MRLRSLLLASFVILSACNQKSLQAVAAPTVLVLSPDSGTLFVGQTLSLTVFTAINNNTTQQVTPTQVTWKSADTSALTVSTGGVVTATGAGTAIAVTASWSGLVATASFNVTGARLASLALTPNPVRVALGQTVALSLQGTLTDGSQIDLTQSVAGTTYVSGNAGIASVSADGVVTGVADGGPVTITATSAGLTATTDALVTAHAVTLSSLTLAPAWQSMTVGGTAAVTLNAEFSDGSTTDVTQDPGTTWSTSDPTLLTVATGGVLTALASGSDVAVIADYGGLRATASVDLVGATLLSIAVQPSQLDLPLNGSTTLSVIGTYSDGHTADVTMMAGLTWSSASPSAVSVNGSTVTGAVAGGPVVVTAMLGTLTGTCDVTVLSLSLVSLAISPASGSVPLRGGLQLVVTGTMSDGSMEDLTSAVSGTVYSSGSSAFMTVGLNGLAQGWQVTSSISVTATNSGQTATALFSVVAGADEIVTLGITPSASRIAIQATLPLAVTATYGDGHSADVTAASTGTVYSVSNLGVGSVSAGGLVTGLANGTVIITAANSGVSAIATIGVGPPAATLTSLVVTPNPIQGDAGTTSQLIVTGQFSDGSSQNLAAAASGTRYSISGNTAVAAVSTRGLVTLTSSGSCVVLVQNGNAQAAVSVTVNARTLVRLLVTPNNLQVPVGFIAQLQVTGVFSDASTSDLTAASTGTVYGAEAQGGGRFNMMPPATAVSVSSGGLVTALALGHGTINVASNGLTASVRVSVVAASVSQVSASAASPSIPVGLTTQLTCNATLTGGQVLNVTAPADGTEWISGNPAVVTVSAGGLATGVAQGAATITCLNNGQAGTVSMTVTPVIAESVTVTPTSTSLPVGSPLALAVTVVFSDGSTQDASSAASGTTYIPSDSSVLSVSADGVVVGLTAGATGTITVLVAGQTATVTIHVTPPVIESISLNPSSVSVAVGNSAAINVLGVLSNGSDTELTTANGLVFSVADMTVATVDVNGNVTGVAPGNTSVYAYVGGLSAAATVSVTGGE